MGNVLLRHTLPFGSVMSVKYFVGSESEGRTCTGVSVGLHLLTTEEERVKKKKT